MTLIQISYRFLCCHCLILALLHLMSSHSNAQTISLDQFDKENKFKVNGGINTSHIYYNNFGSVDNRRNPYTYFLNGNFNMRVFGFDLPFSFSYSNQQASFRQPFNRLKILPKYKWVKLHLGNSSMNWSPLTLSGHMFNGYGIELTPKQFNLSAMYGTLLQAVEIDTLNPNNAPAYKRTGYGVKFGKSTEKGNKIDFILFRAKDDTNSIRKVKDYDLDALENIVVSLNSSFSIKEKIKVNLEVASSAITHDIELPETETSANKFRALGYKYTSSTSFYNAIKGNIAYTHKKFNLGLGYERIAPEYRTLGAYFFNNNLENITVNGGTTLFKKKVSLTGNVGVQRDNLNDAELSSMLRLVGSLNGAWSISPTLNLGLSYSNFFTNTRIRPDIDELNQFLPGQTFSEQDYTQLSQNANANLAWNISNTDKKRENLNVNLAYQVASQQQQGQTQNAGSIFYNMNTTYSRSFVPLGIGLTASINANHNDAGIVKTTTISPNVGVNKAFLKKKLNAQFGLTYNQAINNGASVKSVFNSRLGLRYILKEKHNFSLNTIFLNSNSKQLKSFNELTSTFTYGYSF